MTDDSLSDVQQPKELPLSEFDPRGCRGTNGFPEYYDRAPPRFHDSMFDAPIVTADSVRSQIHAAMVSLEAVKIIEGETSDLRRAISAMHEAFTSVGEHAEDAAAAEKAVR